MFDEDSFSMPTEGDSFKVYRCGGGMNFSFLKLFSLCNIIPEITSCILEESNSDNNSETSSTSDSASDNSRRSDYTDSDSDDDDMSEHRGM